MEYRKIQTLHITWILAQRLQVSNCYPPELPQHQHQGKEWSNGYIQTLCTDRKRQPVQ